jgi:hypothetical protein
MSAAPRPSASDAPALKASGHDFSDDQKESFRALAASTSFVGVCAMLFGVLTSVFFAGALYAGLYPGAIVAAAVTLACVSSAWWMVSAGRALSALVGTRGRDVDHLMEAVRQLRRLFGLARVAIVVLAVAAVAVASWWFGSHSSPTWLGNLTG